MKKLICAGLAVATCMAITSPVLATASVSSVELSTMTVTYDAAKAQTAKGAQALYAKLRSAAADVCTRSSFERAVARWGDQKCAAVALDKAVENVNLASVEALHGGRQGTVEVLASR
jgi:UrcA family protein